MAESAVRQAGSAADIGVVGQIEQRSIDWVPPSERHGTVAGQFRLWFLGNFQPFSIATGFLGVSLGLSLWWSIIAGTLGILIGTLFMAFHASQGPVFGLPQMIQSRAQLGYRGVVVGLFASFFTFMGFNVVDQVIIAFGFNGAYGWNKTAVGIGVTLAAALLAIFGHDWVHKAFKILLYISFPLIVIITGAILLGKAGGAVPAAGGGGWNFPIFISQLWLAAAYNITYAPYVSDYSRYLPKSTRSKPIIAAVFCGASISAIWLIALGAWMGSRLGMKTNDALVGLQISGNNVFSHLGGITTFISTLALVATMGMNAYGAMLTVLTGVDSIRPITPTRKIRVITLLVLMVIWYALARLLENEINALFSALQFMLVLLVPWTAINLVDFFFVRRGRYAITHLFKANGVYGAWSKPGLVAFAVGLVVQLPFLVLAFPIGSWSYAGWASRKFLDMVDYSWVVGLIVSGLAYFVLSKSVNHDAELQAINESDAELNQLDTRHE
jgi:nucleobase:cation symporter-1, NCS1 family